jgi:hypothetical protein
VGMLVRRFPAVVSLEVKWVRSVLTDEALRAVSTCTALMSLDRCGFIKVTAKGLRAVSNLPALTSFNLFNCSVMAAGVQALHSTTAAPNLHIKSRHGALHM